jgi:hypothetical protein
MPFSRPLSMSILAACAAVVLSGCASHRPLAAPPRIVEIYSETRIATLHFPRGTYTLNSEDKRGYYYRAPVGVVEHTAAGGRRREGGVFVSKRNQNKLRGYVMMPYGLTHVGNLSRTEHEFRN